MNSSPTVISTFAGCGGSSLGYKNAGFHELLAIDFNDNACDTFRKNFKTPMWNRDITKVTAKEIMEFCHIKPGELDLFDGSPPCQGFSTAGKRRVNDSRNRLFESFVEILRGLKPKVFVMENVSGMIKGNMKGTFNEILRELEASDYTVKVKLMNAANYQVPQSRQRLIFIGVRKDLKKQPVFPKPDLNWITAAQATKDITPKQYVKLEDEWFTRQLWSKMRYGEQGAKHHPKGSAFNLVKVNPNRPCPTITKSLLIGNNTYGALLHWNEPRTLSIEELKRFATFPDDFEFIGDVKTQWARIGNAVMPKMMQAIATTIREEILS